MKICVNQSPENIRAVLIEKIIPVMVERLVKTRETRASFRVTFEMIPDDIFGDWVECYGATATPQAAKIERVEIG